MAKTKVTKGNKEMQTLKLTKKTTKSSLTYASLTVARKKAASSPNYQMATKKALALKTQTLPENLIIFPKPLS